MSERYFRIIFYIALAVSFVARAGTLKVGATLGATTGLTDDESFMAEHGTDDCNHLVAECAILWVAGNSGERYLLATTPVNSVTNTFSFVFSEVPVKEAIVSMLLKRPYFIEAKGKLTVLGARPARIDLGKSATIAELSPGNGSPNHIKVELDSEVTLNSFALLPRIFNNTNGEMTPNITVGFSRLESYADVSALSENEILKESIKLSRQSVRVLSNEDLRAWKEVLLGAAGASDTRSIKQIYADPTLTERIADLQKFALAAALKFEGLQRTDDFARFIAATPHLGELAEFRDSEELASLKPYIQSDAFTRMRIGDLFTYGEGSLILNDIPAVQISTQTTGGVQQYQWYGNAPTPVQINATSFLSFTKPAPQLSAAPTSTPSTCSGSSWACLTKMKVAASKLKGGTIPALLNRNIERPADPETENQNNQNQMQLD